MHGFGEHVEFLLTEVRRNALGFLVQWDLGPPASF